MYAELGYVDDDSWLQQYQEVHAAHVPRDAGWRRAAMPEVGPIDVPDDVVRGGLDGGGAAVERRLLRPPAHSGRPSSRPWDCPDSPDFPDSPDCLNDLSWACIPIISSGEVQLERRKQPRRRRAVNFAGIPRDRFRSGFRYHPGPAALESQKPIVAAAAASSDPLTEVVRVQSILSYLFIGNQVICVDPRSVNFTIGMWWRCWQADIGLELANIKGHIQENELIYRIFVWLFVRVIVKIRSPGSLFGFFERFFQRSGIRSKRIVVYFLDSWSRIGL